MGGVPVDGRPNGTVGTMISTSLDGEVGRVLGGRYRIIAPIGRGASARVFLADDVTLRRRVAVKVLHEGLADVILTHQGCPMCSVSATAARGPCGARSDRRRRRCSDVRES